MNERQERLITVLAFIAAAVVLAYGDFDTLAAAALGTAGGYSMPRVPAPVALGTGLAVALAVNVAGCTPANTALAHKLTCEALQAGAALCDHTTGGEER